MKKPDYFPELTEAEIIAQMQVSGPRNFSGDWCLPADARLLAQVDLNDVGKREQAKFFVQQKADLNEFLCSKDIVCPYAKGQVMKGLLEYGELESPLEEESIWQIFMKFLESEKRTLVYLFSEETLNHQHAKRWADDWFRSISRMASREQGYSWEGYPNGIWQAPSFEYQGEPFFCFAMGPHYKEGHPRWAPHFIVTVNYTNDIEAVPHDSKVNIVMEQYRRLVYSANPEMGKVWDEGRFGFKRTGNEEQPLEFFVDDFRVIMQAPEVPETILTYRKGLYSDDV